MASNKADTRAYVIGELEAATAILNQLYADDEAGQLGLDNTAYNHIGAAKDELVAAIKELEK